MYNSELRAACIVVEMTQGIIYFSSNFPKTVQCIATDELLQVAVGNVC